MSAGFHVNKEGNTGKCTATQGQCPFGDADRHYPTEAVARQAFELSMAGGAFPKLNPETTANVQAIMAHKEIVAAVEADIQQRLLPGKNFSPSPEAKAVAYDSTQFLKKLAHSPALTTRRNRERLIDGLRDFQDEAKIRAERAFKNSGASFHNAREEGRAWKDVEYSFYNARIGAIAAGDMSLRDAENYATRELTLAIQNSSDKTEPILAEESDFLDGLSASGTDAMVTKDSSEGKRLKESFAFRLMARRDQAQQRVDEIEEHAEPGNGFLRLQEIKATNEDIVDAYTRTLNAMGTVAD